MKFECAWTVFGCALAWLCAPVEDKQLGDAFAIIHVLGCAFRGCRVQVFRHWLRQRHAMPMTSGAALRNWG